MPDYERLKRISEHAGSFLYDWEESDPARHVKSCGASIARILATLLALHEAGNTILIRCSIIPGINDRSDGFRGIAGLVRSMHGMKGVELLAYHRLGEGKSSRFGLDAGTRLEAGEPGPEVVGDWIREVRPLGVRALNEESRV